MIPPTQIAKTFLAALVGLGISLSAQADHHEKNIVETAAANEDFSTLVAAAKAAGVVPMLSEDGPFTVFAPTNEAFEKLPEGTVEMLLKPENKEKLKAILAYHVVPGKIMAADVKTMKAETANGAKASVKVADDGSVTIDKANVVKTDIMATNGVIHVIDAVIMPKEKKGKKKAE